MPQSEPALSPARHAPAILGCAAVLIAAGAGLGAALTVSPSGAPDTRALDRLAAPVQAVPPAAGGSSVPTPPPLLAGTPVEAEPAVAVTTGGVARSFRDSAVAAGAAPAAADEAAALFARKLDFSRDLVPGERFRLVAEARPGGALLFAELGGARVYRFAHDGRVAYLDEQGREPRAALLRTPVDRARVTSGFGFRLHPILGFNRLHPGVDFGAPVGSPVRAAGDGVVEEAGWAGGYGRWLKIAHVGGLETGYGHLLRYAPGVRAGARVAQGQVVAFVGSSGLSTGPHLHFEIMRDGRKLDPAVAPLATEPGLQGPARVAFAAQRRRVDRLIARSAPARLARAVDPKRAAQTG